MIPKYTKADPREKMKAIDNVFSMDGEISKNGQLIC